MAIVLYDLCNAAGRPVSPYSMRAEGALRLLGIEFDRHLLHLGEISDFFEGRHSTVPVVQDGDEMVGDSRTIAEYLAAHHDAGQLLFGTGLHRQLTDFVVDWVDATLMRQIDRMLLLDIHDQFRPEDQGYYRAREEKKYGMTLEALHAERESRLPLFQISLYPARQALKTRPFLTGATACYADVVLFATLAWARAASDFELLREDDRIHSWYAAVEECLART